MRIETPRVAAARNAYNRAQGEAERFEWDLKARQRKLEAEAEAKIRESLQAEFEKLYELRRAASDAREAYDLSKVEAAPKDYKGWPVGTILLEWKAARGYYACATRTFTKTGRAGRLEVWTTQTAHRANLRWGLPDPGDLYVRVLKKSGEDSLDFARLDHSPASRMTCSCGTCIFSEQWLPEGQAPKQGK